MVFEEGNEESMSVDSSEDADVNVADKKESDEGKEEGHVMAKDKEESGRKQPEKPKVRLVLV